MHLQLEGTSLPDLEAQVRADYGPDARIRHVDKVTVGGIRGIFARHHYEVVIEVPGLDQRQAVEPPVVRPRESSRPREFLDVPARVGIAALLQSAEESEAKLNPGATESAAAPGEPTVIGAAPVPSVSTGSDTFARIMEDLVLTTGLAAAETAAAPSVLLPASPSPLHGAGDLVVIVGLGRDPFIVANAMACAANGNGVSVGGALSIAGIPRVEDRQTALAARVQGVRAGHSVFVALGLGPRQPLGAELSERAAAIAQLAADQVWAAVDARNRPGDTADWVRAIASVVRVDAVAVVGG